MNLNFSKQQEDGSGFECPLFCAAAKGDLKMMHMVLQNKSIDVNITDC